MPTSVISKRSFPTALFFCVECGEKKVNEGYGNRPHEPGKFCYKCCAERDWEYMREDGRTTLYIVTANAEKSDYEVTNWPGSLRFRVRRDKLGNHNMGRIRHDVWFVDDDAHEWHGVNVGQHSDLVHCRRLINRQHSRMCTCWQKSTKQGRSK